MCGIVSGIVVVEGDFDVGFVGGGDGEAGYIEEVAFEDRETTRARARGT